jgi:hypothetical protein
MYTECTELFVIVYKFIVLQYLNIGPGSSVGIATGYGLDGLWIESSWGELSHTSPDRPWGPHSLLYNGYRLFPGGKKRPGVTMIHHPLLLPWS